QHHPRLGQQYRPQPPEQSVLRLQPHRQPAGGTLRWHAAETGLRRRTRPRRAPGHRPAALPRVAMTSPVERKAIMHTVEKIGGTSMSRLDEVRNSILTG